MISLFAYVTVDKRSYGVLLLVLLSAFAFFVRFLFHNVLMKIQISLYGHCGVF